MKSAGNKKAAPMLLTILILFMAIASPALAVFEDTRGHWAEDVIEEWVEEGFISGYDDGTFRPDEDVTRAEFVAMVNRSFGFTEQQENLFVDVPLDSWFSGQVDRAVAAGYITGYDDNTFRPQEPISRQEVASISNRLQDLPEASPETLEQLIDAEDIPGWSREAIAAVIAEGLMHGYEDGTFRPQSPITRAESVVTLDRMVEEFPVPEFDARLTLDQDAYQPEDTIIIAVINTGETTIQLGHPFQVEYLDNGEWVEVGLDLAWIFVIEEIEPGFDFQQELVPAEDFQEEPEPGNYRVVKEVRCTVTEQTRNLGDEFTLHIEP